ncbi:MAG: hypothetical protein V8R80_10685 [Eubacterium sp.]
MAYTAPMHTKVTGITNIPWIPTAATTEKYYLYNTSTKNGRQKQPASTNLPPASPVATAVT